MDMTNTAALEKEAAFGFEDAREVPVYVPAAAVEARLRRILPISTFAEWRRKATLPPSN